MPDFEPPASTNLAHNFLAFQAHTSSEPAVLPVMALQKAFHFFAEMNQQLQTLLLRPTVNL
jgi:hypothetical protein